MNDSYQRLRDIFEAHRLHTETMVHRTWLYSNERTAEIIRRIRANAIEQHPVEDPLDDPTKQAQDTDLPEPVTGNDDTEEGEEQE